MRIVEQACSFPALIKRRFVVGYTRMREMRQAWLKQKTLSQLA
jgi:hypothetical protein